jgi:predicted ATP-binding protein involved in virulence
MRIDYIRIDNFRGIEHLELDLDPRFTLLVGDNGSGKTSILSSVAVALGIWHVSKIIGGAKQWRNIMDHEVREVPGVNENGETQFLPVGEIQIFAKGSVNGYSPVRWIRRKRAKGSSTKDQWHQEAVAEIMSVVQARDAQLGALPLLAYYGAGRAWQASNERSKADLSGDLKARRSDGYYDCLNERIRLKDLMKWFVLAAASRDEKGKFKPSFEAVRLALKRGIPGVDDIYWDHLKGELIVSIHGVAQPFSNLSDGQRTMAATLADMAIRAVTLNPHLLGDNQGTFHPEEALNQTPGVVLIDEVDVHLHPEWQRSVVTDLLNTFPKVQFICSTHSPQVIGETQPASLRIYQPKLRTWEIPNQSFGMDSNWILKVHMGGKDMDPEIKSDIVAAEKHAVRREFSQAEALIQSLRERVGNSEEIQFAASTLERLKLVGK